MCKKRTGENDIYNDARYFTKKVNILRGSLWDAQRKMNVFKSLGNPFWHFVNGKEAAAGKLEWMKKKVTQMIRELN